MRFARRSQSEPIPLNLVPMLDAMVTLIAFLLYTASFIALATIDSPVPLVSAPSKAQDRPLQLTLTLGEKSVTLWSPFDRIKTTKIPHLADGTFALDALHQAILEVKRKFPTETKLVLVPSSTTSYDELVGVMDTVRDPVAADPGIPLPADKDGIERVAARLFPEIVFGNLLGGGGKDPE